MSIERHKVLWTRQEWSSARATVLSRPLLLDHFLKRRSVHVLPATPPAEECTGFLVINHTRSKVFHRAPDLRPLCPHSASFPTTDTRAHAHIHVWFKLTPLNFCSCSPHLECHPYSLLPIPSCSPLKAQMKLHLSNVVPVGLVPVHDFISELQLHLLPLNLIVH